IARIQAQDAARESERFLSNIFDSMQDGISVLDTNLNIVRVNSVMERWLAHAMPLVGKKCYEAFHRADEPCPVCPVRETCKAAQPAYQLIPVKGPYNQVLGWLDLYTFPVFDPESGKLTRVIEYVRNATDRKRAEDQPLQE
ncbi:MAG: PAS domain-containing protein, partial [Deltaproteobacteria bacterium]|nr:PAS domain-containing protein [Deltaproteobacteria bacterium]